MTINHDRTYINPDKELLVAGGYAEERIHQIRICFQYTEEQKEDNRRNAEQLKTKQQEDTYYKKAYTMRSEYIHPVLCRLAEVFKIHQFSPYDTTRFNSRDWDLFFWCNCFENTVHGLGLTGRDYSYATLSFNDRHTGDEQLATCNRALQLLSDEFSNLENLCVSLQYGLHVFQARLRRDIPDMISSLNGEKYSMHGRDGRLTAVNGSLYWMKKYAKNRGVKLDDDRIAAIYLSLSQKGK